MDAIRGQLSEIPEDPSFTSWFEPLLEEALNRISPSTSKEHHLPKPGTKKIEPQRRFYSTKRKSQKVRNVQMGKPTALEQITMHSALKGEEDTECEETSGYDHPYSKLRK